jgi:hypothetical protein
MVMVDLKEYYADLKRKEDMRKSELSWLGLGRASELPQLMGDTDQRTYISDCPCPACSCADKVKARKTPIFGGYDTITQSRYDTLTDHMYFLCACDVTVFAFSSRTWGRCTLKAGDRPAGIRAYKQCREDPREKPLRPEVRTRYDYPPGDG